MDFPTRDNNTLDVFITNRPSLINHCYPISGLAIGDHEIVYVESFVKAPMSQCVKRTVYIWIKADFDNLRHNFAHFSSDFLNKYSSHTPLSQLWNEFKSMCEECLKHIPVKPCPTTLKQPWRTPI